MFRFIRPIVMLGLLSLALLSGCVNIQEPNTANTCFEARNHHFSEVLACYKLAATSQSLQYSAKETQQFPGIVKRSFTMLSQNWSPDKLLRPEQWKHQVDIYIPNDALHGQALLIANNGINNPYGSNGVKTASDIDENMALSIARQTRTIVVSVSDIPNQYLTYTDDGIARREDDSVAHSWKLFLANPETRPFMSLHLPMMASIVKAMDLAQKELQPWQVNRFIATGASKRAWGSWLTAIADERISAIAPFVIDILNTSSVLNHTYQTYGNNWPLAFAAYQHEGITKQLQTDNFDKLLQIEDPLRYLNSAYAKRLSIPKYIVNASSDDFFVPDNARFYFDQLPGQKALRVAPNASHYGIRKFIEDSLIPMINRLQQRLALPTINTQWQNSTSNSMLSLYFSETPVSLTQWTATNPVARDFRYPCGIRYQPTGITFDKTQNAQVAISTPKQGWSATFIEATFSDGFTTTTPVYVTPNTYPTTKPPTIEPTCQTVTDDS